MNFIKSPGSAANLHSAPPQESLSLLMTAVYLGSWSAVEPVAVPPGLPLHPAGHARSPAMHNAAYAALGIEAVYLAFDVPPQTLGAALVR